MKAARTVLVASMVFPNTMTSCRSHVIWYTKADAPEKQNNTSTPKYSSIDRNPDFLNIVIISI